MKISNSKISYSSIFGIDHGKRVLEETIRDATKDAFKKSFVQKIDDTPEERGTCKIAFPGKNGDFEAYCEWQQIQFDEIDPLRVGRGEEVQRVNEFCKSLESLILNDRYFSETCALFRNGK